MSRKLSTSALAKRLEIPSQQLFALLVDKQWIQKGEEGWLLTGKGEFEGGEYYNSKRYGRYIAWPESLLEHPLIKSQESGKMLSAAQLGADYGLGAQGVNRALAELAWQRRDYHGWQIGARGELLGGVQMENTQSGMRYTLWPEELKRNEELISLLCFCQQVQAEALTESLTEKAGAESAAQPADDLFASPSNATAAQRQGSYRGLDGRDFACPGKRLISHWLYMAGLVHACDRRLPGEQGLHADFYLPRGQVYIEYWAEAEDSSALSARLKRQAHYEAMNLRVIDLHPEDLAQLDELLPRQLGRWHVPYY